MPYPNRMEYVSSTIRVADGPPLLRREAWAYVRLEMQRVQRLTRGFILSQPIGKAVYSISD